MERAGFLARVPVWAGGFFGAAPRGLGAVLAGLLGFRVGGILAGAHDHLETLHGNLNRYWDRSFDRKGKPAKATSPEPVATKPVNSPADATELSFGVQATIERILNRVGAAKALLDEPDNTPMPWEDVCAAGYTLDGTVLQLETLRDEMKAWRVGRRTKPASTTETPEPAPAAKTANNDSAVTDDQIAAKILPTLPLTFQSYGMREGGSEGLAFACRVAISQILCGYQNSDDFDLAAYAKLLDALPDGWLEAQVAAENGAGEKAVA